MSEFVKLDVVSGKQDSPDSFVLTVRPELIAAFNVIMESPNENAKTVVYFTADSGLKSVMSSMSPEEIEKILEAYHDA